MINACIATYGKRLYGLCLTLCGSSFEVEDLYQDTWLQVHFLTDSRSDKRDRLCTVSCSIDKIARIETYRNAIKINCEVTKVDYGLTMFEIVPQD